MNRFAVCLAALACLACFGCADKPVEVDMTKPSGDEASNDYLECQAKAYTASAISPKDKDVEAWRQEMIDACMKAKGYTVNE